MQGGVSGWTLGKIYSKSGDALAGKCWSSLLREVLESMFLEVLKNSVDVALSDVD